MASHSQLSGTLATWSLTLKLSGPVTCSLTGSEVRSCNECRKQLSWADAPPISTSVTSTIVLTEVLSPHTSDQSTACTAKALATEASDMALSKRRPDPGAAQTGQLGGKENTLPHAAALHLVTDCNSASAMTSVASSDKKQQSICPAKCKICLQLLCR